MTSARVAYASGMIGLGVLTLVYGDFALQWEPVPTWVPWRHVLAYASGVVMLVGGLGLLFARVVAWSTRLLFSYVAIWWLLLKVPRVLAAPLVAQSWLGCGEIAVLLAGAWVLFADVADSRSRSRMTFFAGESGVRSARYLFALALPAIGLSHFVYASQTANLVPAWLAARTAWAYATGAGHIAAGLGVLLSIYPRLAATMEAGMLTAFTVLVWIPAVFAGPTTRLSWTALTISWAISVGAWAVAASIPASAAENSPDFSACPTI